MKYNVSKVHASLYFEIHEPPNLVPRAFLVVARELRKTLVK
jgi:hypothetical protein